MIQKRNIDEIRKTKSIILFDGLCSLCDVSVQFVLKRDSNNKFMFASLQSKEAMAFINSQTLEIRNTDSILLVTAESVYVKSSAAIKIGKQLNGLWFLTGVFYIIPVKFRDMIYSVIAKKRYQWFGRFDTCKVPSEETKEKFLI